MKRNNEHGICCVFCTCVTPPCCVYRNYGIKQITRHITFISLSSNKGVIQGRMIICSEPAAPCLGANICSNRPTDRIKYCATTMDKYKHTINKNTLALLAFSASLHGRGSVFSSYSLYFIIFFPSSPCQHSHNSKT